MKAKMLVPIAVAAAFGFATLAPHAQTAGQKIGFVDVQKVLAAAPGSAAIKTLQDKANTELGGYDTQIKAIDAKGANATAADKDKRTQLVATAQAAAKNYEAQNQKLVAPIEQTVDTAVANVAKAQGFSVIMDRAQAAGSGLVIYADSNTDMTDAVLKALPK